MQIKMKEVKKKNYKPMKITFKFKIKIQFQNNREIYN